MACFLGVLDLLFYPDTLLHPLPSTQRRKLQKTAESPWEDVFASQPNLQNLQIQLGQQLSMAHFTNLVDRQLLQVKTTYGGSQARSGGASRSPRGCRFFEINQIQYDTMAGQMAGFSKDIYKLLYKNVGFTPTSIRRFMTSLSL